MGLDPNYTTDGGDWICARCGKPLEQLKVQAFYMHSAFDVILPRCPECDLTLIPQSLAEGKMAEVEALLEDK
ncbi:MAG: DNA-binding protein [Desulfovibrionaceae bacterium]|nr:DNA-binding protein [Desulfovibrionaceae bacterium]